MRVLSRTESAFAAAAMPHLRAWVSTGTSIIAVGYTISVILNVVLDRWDLWTTSEVLAALIATAGVILAQRNKVMTAALLTLGGVWLELHVGPFSSGKIGLEGATVLPVIVVTTGLFLGGRVALILGAFTAVSYPAAGELGVLLFHRGVGVDAENVHQVAILAVTLVGAAAMVHVGRRSFGDVLQSALTNERKFSLLVRDAPDGIVLLDAQGRIESLNPAAERLLNTDERTAHRLRLRDLLAPLTLDTDIALPEFNEVGAQPKELVLVHGGNHRVAVELTIGRTVLTDGSDGTQIMLHDVTERREIERYATQLGHMIDETLGEVYAFDAESLQLRIVNQGARLNLGYDEDPSGRLTITDINPSLTMRRVRRLVTELSGRAAESVRERGIHRRADGSTYPVELRLQLAHLADEPAIAVFALDISDRLASEDAQERLRTQLQQAQKMEAVGQLAGGVAHDFNNLLMAVGGYAEMIREFSGDDRVIQWAERIHQAQAQGAALTRRLLGFARKDVTQPRLVSVMDVLEQLRPILIKLLGERVTLTLEGSGRDTVFVDRAQLEQVVVNLVANARDAMPEGGRAEIVVRGLAAEDGEGPRDVVLEIRDSGVGMDEETRRRAFDPFFTTKPREKGTGLGLTTVHSIVTQAGGQVELVSALGNGTTARVRFPEPQVVPPPRPEEEQVVTPQRLEPATILLVEDDEGTRELVQLMLARAGHTVVTAVSAEEALDCIEERAHEIDLLLSDVVLPGRTGFDLARDVRERHPRIRLLHMSGYLDNLPLPRDMGFDPSLDLLLKPFSAAELLSRVADALQA